MRSRTQRAVTVHDVARRAGVSQPTASLVLSGHPTARVAPATRERVRRAAEELGYRPNVVARGLQQRRSFALGVIVPDLRNPFSIEVISGAERVAAEEGHAVLLCDARERSITAHLEELHARWIDGVIIEPAVNSSEMPLSQNVIMINQPSVERASVFADMEGAGELAARHLVELGHRGIGFIGPASDLFRYRSMERAFVRALRQAGITIRSEWLRRAAPSARGGEQAARALLSLPHRPTALFCANDLIAIGALKACAARGLGVPREFSIIGCDDIETARLVQPELTTIAVPARELGARAARMLIRGIERLRTRTPQPLPVRLVERGTTARLAS
ncbi:MAG: LacI family DNA-binding transcriptional regulator [Gemmatimonadota bacterium]